MRPTIVGGIAGVVLGFVAVLDRGVASVVELDYLSVTFVGVTTGLIGMYYLSRRREAPRRLTTFDDPEPRYRAVVPGDDIDDQIDRLQVKPGLRSSGRGMRDRLRDAAIRSLVVHAGYDADAARSAVENGSWTDDPIAASFLAGDDEYPTGIRIRAFLGGPNLPKVGARRSIEAIVAVMES